MAEHAPLFFPYRFARKWSLLYKALGVRDDDGVVLTADGRMVATYGRFQVDTPIGNVADTSTSGPHRWYTAVGVRLSFADDGLTFGTNADFGLCIEFVDKVPKVIGPKDHSALWVSVADPYGLANALG